jgi:anti-sigma factor RsiW
MNHEQIKEKIFSLYDGEAPAEDREALEAHLQGCSDCRAELARWGQIRSGILLPLKVEYSEAFVHQVMRKVRSYESIRWPQMVRWLVPALALSVSGFAGVMVYNLQPSLSTESLLMSGPEQTLSHEWLNNLPDNDQLMNAMVNK